MIYTMLFLTAFMLVLLFRNYRNTYTWILIMTTIGMAVCIFSILMFVSRTSYYSLTTSFDYRLFRYLSSIRINYFNIFKLLNIGIAMYLFSIALFVSAYLKPKQYQPRFQLIFIILTIIPPILFILSYHPTTSYFFYLQYHNHSESYKSFLKLVLSIIDVFSYLWIITYLIAPLVILLIFYVRSRAIFFKKRNITFLICFLVMNALFFTMFFTGNFRKLFIYTPNPEFGFVKHIVSMQIPFYYYNILPVIMLIALSVMIYMLLASKGLETVDAFRKIFIEKNIMELNKYFIGFLHGFKNTFFNIKILAIRAEEELAPQTNQSLSKIESIATESMTNIGITINSLKNINIKPKRNNLQDCVESALADIQRNAGDFTITKKYDPYHQTYAYFDFYLMKSVFSNIFKNAVEAIQLKSVEKGRITIDISAQSGLIAVSVTDNGIGVKRKDKRKLFKMFYTTKSRQKNWGAGLQYVANIVRNHLGIINVYSRYNEYTCFEIILNQAPIA